MGLTSNPQKKHAEILVSPSFLLWGGGGGGGECDDQMR